MATNYLQDANCVGAWLFRQGSGQVVHDDSGNGNFGVFKSSTEPGWNATDVNYGTTGAAPNSVLFDDNDDVIDCGKNDAVLPYNAACTIVALINPTAIDNDRIIDRNSLYFAVGGTNALLFNVAGSTAVYRYSANNSLDTSTWQHVAVTWDGGTTATGIKFYKNGAETSYGGSQNGSTLTSNAGFATRIGNRSVDLIRCFNGYITEIAVFSRVLSQPEIEEIYNYGIAGGNVVTTTGQMLPTSATTSAIGDWADDTWVSAAGLLTIDTVTAQATADAARITASTFDENDQSYILKASNFNLTVPDGYNIAGVTFRAKAWANVSCYVDTLKLLDTSREEAGSSKATTTVMLSATTQIISFGGSADTWGNALTSAWVKNANFGVGLGVYAKAANVDVFIDYVTLEVYYTAPSTAPLSLKYFFVEC